MLQFLTVQRLREANPEAASHLTDAEAIMSRPPTFRAPCVHLKHLAGSSSWLFMLLAMTAFGFMFASLTGALLLPDAYLYVTLANHVMYVLLATAMFSFIFALALLLPHADHHKTEVLKDAFVEVRIDAVTTYYASSTSVQLLVHRQSHQLNSP